MLSVKKVLILYITERSGHHSAASALKRGFEIVDPAVTVKCINAFRYFFPVAEWLTHKLYLFVIKEFRLSGVFFMIVLLLSKRATVLRDGCTAEHSVN